ncbi:dual specificity phosphatase-like protein 2 [Dinothrombium tinctorium]|uniref:Dual specificity phosphatase-like protein 2 n=1 Tax=Dinothrombium tinctorium TaxID=1965070 RepID=A0A3S3P422_9ACAR|nr:dual specificity phosphatase-like protein 2 [Dinothrombium tinctorium]
MEDRSGLFNEIQKFSQRKLKKVETKLVTGTGDKVVEKRGAKGLQTVKNDSPGAGANAASKKNLDLQVGLVIPGLLIASEDVAQHRATLDEYGVTHILNLCSSEVDNKFEDDLNYKSLDIIDSPQVDIKKYFDECFEFIDEGRQRGNCLVHCNTVTPGLSRSTAICVAYLIKSEKKKFAEAYNEVKEARAFVKPNDGFMKQLMAYEAEILGAQQQEEVQDSFTLKKRQEIEAEKEMLKSKISIKDKVKAFAPTTLDVPEQSRSPSPNRLRTDWINSTDGQKGDETGAQQAQEERPAPRKLTSILSIFQQKEAKENQTPNQPFAKNTAPTRKWKPVEIKGLQGTKGPEVKKGFTYDKVRKSKSKEWKGRDPALKKTKSKVLTKSDSVQRDEPKSVPTNSEEKSPATFSTSVLINNPTPKYEPVVDKSKSTPQKEVSNETAPWRKTRENERKQSHSSIVIQPQNKPQEAQVQKQASKEPQLQRQMAMEATEVKATPQNDQSTTKKVFGRIPPPPMKIIGREVSLTDDRKLSLSHNPAPAPPPPPPPTQSTNITISSTKKAPDTQSKATC